jgi:octaprenyl-diphosphate synthase
MSTAVQDSSVSEDFHQVNVLIRESLGTDVALISQLANYIILGGGKRLRPKLALLSARAAGYTGARDHIICAAIVEFIHTATLLHDDVVDTSEKRRGRDTANAVFGNQTAVLTGDFLYSRAFQMMVDVDRMAVMKNLADTTNVIAEGEVMQLMNMHEPDISEARYFEVIYRKTARLFESACELGAIVADHAEAVAALGGFGRHLGNAFQLVDDALDYDLGNDGIGKNHGDDLAEGKPTLPLIYALEYAKSHEQELIRSAIVEGDVSQLDAVVAVIKATEAIDYTLKQASREVDAAVESLATLPDSDYKAELIDIARSSVNRKV